MRRADKRLSINKETFRALNAAHLAGAVGAAVTSDPECTRCSVSAFESCLATCGHTRFQCNTAASCPTNDGTC
jgi:hypothetical protein